MTPNRVFLLTCRPWKGGFLRDAADEKIALVFPDTSPRGANVQGEDEDWDFGTGEQSPCFRYTTTTYCISHSHLYVGAGAGFYIDATAANPDANWSRNYNMFSFVTEELPALLTSQKIPLVRFSHLPLLPAQH